ncbi:hypothetical protein FOCC_FOCC000886 [Frankliniella occidentalis]|nr:hypothetical protein FOCC_FOCC000886 [Frankliniella occidentalis]
MDPKVSEARRLALLKIKKNMRDISYRNRNETADSEISHQREASPVIVSSAPVSMQDAAAYYCVRPKLMKRKLCGQDIKDDSKIYKFHCKGDMMNRWHDYTVEELASNKEACGCFGDERDYHWETILISELELVERPEAVVSNKLHCHPGHGACVLEIEHIKSFTVTTGFEMSTSLDFSKVVPASVTLTKKTDWARTTGTSLKYQCQAQEGYSTWISIKPQYYKAKTLQPTGLYTRRNGETGIPVCDVADVYLPRINSHGSIAGDVHCHAEKLNL